MKFSVSNRTVSEILWEMNEIKIFLYNENAWENSHTCKYVLIFNFSVLTQEASSQGISRCVLENFTKKKLCLYKFKEEEKTEKPLEIFQSQQVACYLKIKIKLNALKKLQ